MHAGSFRQLFATAQRRTTILLWLIWFLGSVGLYGVLVYLPTVFQQKGLTPGDNLYQGYFPYFLSLQTLPLFCAVFTVVDRIPVRHLF